MGRFLLDTHGFLWLIQGDSQLSERARAVISDDANQLYFSVASIWEITIKLNIGKLKIGHTIEDIYTLLAQLKVEVLSIDRSDLVQYLTLPLHHRDPFDRILIAQAIDRDLVLVSADESFGAYSIQRLW
jgi:PIN domain nuclease of toxin-antitoxin system